MFAYQIFLVKMKHEVRERAVFELLFYEPVKALLLGSLIVLSRRRAEAEESFEEKFSKRLFPVIYDNGSFSLDTRSFYLHLFLRLMLRR